MSCFQSCPIVSATLLVFGSLPGQGCGSPSLSNRVILLGHTGSVTSVAFAPDGKTLASRGMDATVRVWDLARNQERSILTGVPSEMGAVTFSPDGLTLAANEATLGLVAWDTATGQRRTDYVYPKSSETYWGCYSVAYGWGIAYSADGKTLASGGSHSGEDGFVTLWDVTSLEGSNLARHDGPITSVAISPDGKTVASASLDGTVRLWDRETGKERVTLRGQGRGLFATLCFTPEGDKLVTACEDRTIRSWDVATGREVGRIGPNRDEILCLVLSPAGDVLAVSDKGGGVVLCAARTGRVLTRLDGHRGRVWCIAFSPDGQTIATGGMDNSVRVWDVAHPP